ncbi:MAG TPA: hypothetical protein VFQ67_09390 [Allosphingosinicella sp.]|jgi:hypothetical protein|nr:hypothetical protein [Allosphingosinicella sp.]
MRFALLLPLAALALSGCVAKTAIDTAVGVAAIPVKVASAGVDAAITTQAEADRKRGREIRRQEECVGKEDRQARKQNREPDYEKCEPRN